MIPKGRIWITADNHYNHPNLLKYCYRPEGYEELVTKQLEEFVQEGDILINLGDVIIYEPNQLKDYMKNIKGTKILVRGNHDQKSDSWYIRQGFDIVCDSIVMKKILFTHKPAESIPRHIRLNIHGHLHNSQHHDDETDSFLTDKHYLIAIENTKYKPVLLESIIGKLFSK